MPLPDEELSRTEIEFPDGEEGRVYWYPSDMVPFASVTTVLGRKHDPQKDAAIEGWKKKYHGQDGAVWWEHLLWWTQKRGTIIHWYVLSHLDPELEISHEERDAFAEIKKYDTDYHRVYSVVGGRNDVANHSLLPAEIDYMMDLAFDDAPNHPTLKGILYDDMEWCLRQFANLCPELGLADISFAESDCQLLEDYFENHVHRERVVQVEQFVQHEEQQFAGQYDLLIEMEDGTTVLADLKTSRAFRWSHQCQGAAYAAAVEQEIPVDECAVVQLHPDHEAYGVLWEDDFEEDRESLWETFIRVNQEHVLPVVAEINLENEVEA